MPGEKSSDQGNPDRKAGMFARVVGQEAVLVLLLSGVAYLFSYFYKRSYFAYFGVDSAYINIEITDLLVSATVVIGFLAIALSLSGLWMLPARLFEYIMAIMVGHKPAILFIALFSASMIGGRNGKSGFLLAIAIAAIAYEVFEVLRNWRKGSTYESYLERMIGIENNLNESSLLGKAFNFAGIGVVAALVFLVIVPFGVGTFSGRYLASSQKVFSTLERDGELFVLIGRYADGMLLAEVDRSGAHQRVLPEQPKVVWLANSELSGVVLQRQRFSEGISRPSAEESEQ